MSILDLQSAVETKLAQIVPYLPIAGENNIFVPQANIPYQELYWMFATPENPTIGGGTFYVEKGIFQTTLKYLINTGRVDAMVRLDLIRAAFQAQTALALPLGTFIIQSTPVAAQGRVDGDRWSVPVKIPFRAYMRG